MNEEDTQKVYLQEFLSEGRDVLDQIERDILNLETAPQERSLLNNIFRNMHTIKGNCRLMGFLRLEELTHSAENLLHLLREGEIIANGEIDSLLLNVVDLVRTTMLDIEKNDNEGDPDFTIEVAKLDSIQADAGALNLFEKSDFTEDDDELLPSVDISLGDEDDSGSLGETSSAIETVRLPIERLDDLMNLTGELGATFNQLRYSVTRKEETVTQVLEVMEQQIHNLQDEVLKYRLQPISRVWDTFHRLVRDLAYESGKKVFLEMKGEDTELDRNVLLSIKDLLGHLIRNAMDHGIELPDERISAGKPALAVIRLSAEQRHGQIYMEISDNGRGLNVGRIKEKALDTGLTTSKQLDGMKDEEVYKFIMEPGFSTAEKVSKISGRGTGMDVVKSAVEKVGGIISIRSEPGMGTDFRIRIPQTMAIVPSLLVHSGEEQFAVPQVNIIELISYYGDDVKKNIEEKMGLPMVRVREHLLPLLLLRQITENIYDYAVENFSSQLKLKSECQLLILQSEEGKFGLEVDRIDEPVSLVIKPLPRIFSHISILAGSAVMPDGTVSFLLNVSELGKLRGV